MSGLGKLAALVTIAVGVYELYDHWRTRQQQAQVGANTYVSGGWASPVPGSTGSATSYYGGGSPEATVW